VQARAKIGASVDDPSQSPRCEPIGRTKAVVIGERCVLTKNCNAHSLRLSQFLEETAVGTNARAAHRQKKPR